jgi:SAM-dependent methyltransferase
VAGGYDPVFFEELAAVEDRHFWFRARNDLLSRITRRLTAKLLPGFYVLEPGCGTGNVLRFLKDSCPKGSVIGMDLYYEGLLHAHRRTGCPLVQGDMQIPPFIRQFELVGMFDVLEHLPHDDQILRDLWALLAPGGALLLTVPAHMSLWSYFDESAHHCRRYEPSELRTRLEEAGFKVEFLTQFMACTYPLVWLNRKISGRMTAPQTLQEKQKLASRDIRIIPGLNGILSLFLHLESRWVGAGRSLPIGTSLLAVARKPKTAA